MAPRVLRRRRGGEAGSLDHHRLLHAARVARSRDGLQPRQCRRAQPGVPAAAHVPPLGGPVHGKAAHPGACRGSPGAVRRPPNVHAEAQEGAAVLGRHTHSRRRLRARDQARAQHGVARCALLREHRRRGRLRRGREAGRRHRRDRDRRQHPLDRRPARAALRRLRPPARAHRGHPRATRHALREPDHESAAWQRAHSKSHGRIPAANSSWSAIRSSSRLAWTACPRPRSTGSR